MSQWADAFAAAYFGMSVGSLRRARAVLSRQVDAAVSGILERETVVRALARLPFESGSTIVGLGDEWTSDVHSWFEILGRAHARASSEKNVRFVNCAVFGFGTGDILSRMSVIAALQPSHVLCMAGLNDVTRSCSPGSSLRMSIGEIDRNFHELRTSIPGAEWLMIVPPPTLGPIDGRTEPMHLGPMPKFWPSSDLDAVRSLVRFQDAAVLDASGVFGTPPKTKYFECDGIHPNTEGQIRLACRIIRELAYARRPSARPDWSVP